LQKQLPSGLNFSADEAEFEQSQQKKLAGIYGRQNSTVERSPLFIIAGANCAIF